MKWIDLSLPTPAENLACDEALLEMCEAGYEHEILRFWESEERFVVLGYGNKAATEVKLDGCKANAIPILRRTSGGGTVLQGPGCMNFSLILRIPPNGPLAGITSTNEFITERNAEALRELLGKEVQARGLSDLSLGDFKFSGNAQRRKKRFLLFHGTFLTDFEIPLVEQTLALPSRQPDYRRNRAHEEFLVNAPTTPEAIKAALKQAWGAGAALGGDLPESAIERLAGIDWRHVL